MIGRESYIPNELYSICGIMTQAVYPVRWNNTALEHPANGGCVKQDLKQRRSIFSIPLVRELTAVLIIKLALVFLIAHFFFSDPVIVGDEGQGLREHFGLDNPSVSDTQGDPS